MNEKTNECAVCDYRDDSRLDLLEHVYEEHSQAERHAVLVDRVPASEVPADAPK